jgi:type VI protein secretion system component VasF
MEWFSRKTAIAGIQIPTWLVALGAIIVLLLIYTFMQEAQPG